MDSSPDEYFEISAVSRLTGISSQLLRMWERRYSVVDPDRSNSKRRRYTRSDVQKLTILKELVDCGHAIGSIAGLSVEQLEERRAEVAEKESAAAGSETPMLGGRVAVVGETLTGLLRQLSEENPGVRLVGQCQSIEELMSVLRPGGAEILVIEYETLFADDLDVLMKSLSALEISRAVLVYEFAQKEALEKAESSRIFTLKAPVGVNEVAQACAVSMRDGKQSTGDSSQEAEFAPLARDFVRPKMGKIPKKRYSYSDLVKIGKISSVVQCECPQHLARLISSLSAFERYSQQCEDRNEEDAKLHGFLHHATADCRAKMEEALTEVLQQEGIEI